MIQHLPMISTTKLNIFPYKGGILVYYDNQIILNQINWDYEKHFQYEFGSYVQENQVNKPTNTNLARTMEAIYIRPTTNLQGVHKLMDICTSRLITRPKVYPCVITKIVIKSVEKLA